MKHRSNIDVFRAFLSKTHAQNISGSLQVKNSLLISAGWVIAINSDKIRILDASQFQKSYIVARNLLQLVAFFDSEGINFEKYDSAPKLEWYEEYL